MSEPINVPVIWSYDYNMIVGGATLHDDGTVTVTIKDPRMADAIVRDKVAGIAIHKQPAAPEPD